MTELWRIEDEVRGRNADSRSVLRQEKSATIVTNVAYCPKLTITIGWLQFHCSFADP